MKKLIILLVTIGGLSLVGCDKGTNDTLGCDHNPSCKTFREHDLLVLKESEAKDNNISNEQKENVDTNISKNNDNKDTSKVDKNKKQTYYRVITGSYADKENALNHVEKLKSNKIDCFISEYKVDKEIRYRIVSGSFKTKENAQKQAQILNELGYETFISEFKA